MEHVRLKLEAPDRGRVPEGLLTFLCDYCRFVASAQTVQAGTEAILAHAEWSKCFSPQTAVIRKDP